MPTITQQIFTGEGTGRNPLSSARDLFQMINSTFVGMFRQMYPEQARGKTDQEIVAMRTPELSAQMGPVLIQQNARALSNAGITPNAGNVYLAHFLGVKGALDAFRANPNTPAIDVVGKDAVDANPTIMKGKTIGEVIQFANNYMDRQAGFPAARGVTSRRPFVPNVPSETPMSPMAPTVANAMALGMAGAIPPPAPANAMIAPPAPVQLSAPPIAAPTPTAPPARATPEFGKGTKSLTATEEKKLRDDIAVDYASARSTIATMDDVLQSVDDLRKVPDKDKEAILGFIDARTPVTRRGSISAQAKLDNLVGQVTAMGKAATSLSGAVGNMAVQEWKIVADQIASLDPTRLDAKELNKQLELIEAKAKAAASRTRDAYRRQYFEEFDRFGDRFKLPEDSSSGGKPPSVEDLLKKYGG
jgi:hypothetical protein